MSDEWIVIPGWDKWQSRRDRHDPWIKTYIDQLDRDEYLELTSAERGILNDLRMVFARFNGQAKLSHFASITNSRPLQKQLDRLVQAGLLQLSAAKPPLARAKEVEREKEIPKSLSRKTVDNRRVTGWREVRGTHGISHIPDPLGTDPPPVYVRGM